MIRRGAGEGTASVSRGTTSRKRSGELPRFFPELEPSYQVTISSGATKVIREDVGWSARNMRGLESGGWLLSYPTRPDSIIFATVPGSDAEFSRSSSQASINLGVEEVEKATRALPNAQVIGDWHLEPDGSGQPSETDRRAWASCWELTRSFWVGVIATPAPNMWAAPTLHGWITTGSEGHLYCEPLRIREF